MALYGNWDPASSWDRYVEEHPCSFCFDEGACPGCPYVDDEEDEEE